VALESIWTGLGMPSLFPADRPMLRFPHLATTQLRECDAVALAALEHLGKAYRITRELHPGLIDCSTVVSQAHWTGAGIQTPFIAESQRRARNASTVEMDDLLPGDAIYAYRSREESPGGRHNHVGLFLGDDEDGKAWVIESREETGAVLTELSGVQSGGGIRRFCIEPHRVFPNGDWPELVRRVPKLSRLGSRLTANYGSGRRHRGIDVYVEINWPVISPITGTVIEIRKVSGSLGSFVGIWSRKLSCYSVLGPLSTAVNIRRGADISQGDLLGGPVHASAPAGCNTVPNAPGAVRLHWELWAPEKFGVSPASDLPSYDLPRRSRTTGDVVAHNSLYAMKRGDIGCCVVLQ
jgi:cell wall-associated NlpC family hydrolase